MMRVLQVAVMAAYVWILGGGAAAGAADSWQGGVASIDITPQQPMWMSGYASRDRPAEGKLHDLHAKAIALVDPQGAKAVLVTLDLVGIDRDISEGICDRLKSQYGLERRQVALASSHTHTGPVVGTNLGSMYFYDAAQATLVEQYTRELQDRVVEVVGNALQKLAPVTLKHGLGQASFAVNRRNNREPDVPQLREAGMLKGPVDHELPVLTMTSADGTLEAVVFGYACHATTLDSYQWSGDWPGFAQLEIERRHPGTTALFWAGCGADQNPIPRRSVELAQAYGNQTADAVDAVLAGSMEKIEGRLETAYREIDLEFGELPTREEIEKDTQSDNRYVGSRARLLLAQLEKDGGLASTYPYPVQVWQLGNEVTFVLLGGEVVVDYSLRLKQDFPDRQIWVAGYCNDVMAYIPSLRVLNEGGYEGGGAMVYYGLPTAWSPRVEEHIVGAVAEMVTALDK